MAAKKSSTKSKTPAKRRRRRAAPKAKAKRRRSVKVEDKITADHFMTAAAGAAAYGAVRVIPAFIEDPKTAAAVLQYTPLAVIGGAALFMGSVKGKGKLALLGLGCAAVAELVVQEAVPAVLSPEKMARLDQLRAQVEQSRLAGPMDPATPYAFPSFLTANGNYPVQRVAPPAGLGALYDRAPLGALYDGGAPELDLGV